MILRRDLISSDVTNVPQQREETTMGGRKKRGNALGNNSKQSKPRRGEQTKQVKEAQAKELETKSIRQTKLAFASNGSPENVKPPPAKGNVAPPIVPVQKKLSFAEAAGTPQKPKETRDTTKSTAITPEPKTGPIVTLNTKPLTTVDTSTAEISLKEKNIASNEQNETQIESDEEELVSGKATAKPTPTTNTDDDNNKKLPESRATIKSTTKTTRHTKSKTTGTTTTASNETGTYNTPGKFRTIRYNGLIETPPSEKPFEDFVTLLKEYFKIIQEVLGKDIYIAAWDDEQGKTFPPIKKPSKLPASRESLGIYLGTYINPKTDGSKVYLNLRLVTLTPHQVPLDRFGMELADQFASSKHRMTIHRQPRPCQAAKSECIGWMMYSCKSMNSATFIPAIKKALNIPEDVEIGIQYRTIANEHGKKPPFNRDDPPAAAIHLDIDERYALVYQTRASSLWRKNSKK